jgi:dTDP-4-dehydrorhamnose 3,5-epimerase
MIFTELVLKGAFLIEPERQEDERGFFARTFFVEEFAARELCMTFAQCSVSFNRRRGTLRGLHYEVHPHAEVKLVRCTAGAAFDVLVDIRPGSATFGRWCAVELTADNRQMVYIPEGFAHGFQALADGTELFYQISTPYAAAAARGIRWNDADLAIGWPLPVTTLSTRDGGLPAFASVVARGRAAPR